jgi:DNA-binding CsgD family transcriptional regulator
MTDEEKASHLRLFGARHASDDAPSPRLLATVAAILLLVVVLVGLDVAGDTGSGGSRLHLALELLLMAAALAGTVLLGRALVAARGRASALARDLTSARADASRFHAESVEYLRGLAAAIDHQFDRWALTGAEREVALLLLKGLSSKEVASVRATSERTVRQQALAVYRKAGLAGRAELAAFFLEDLLQPAAGAGAPRASTVP